MERVVLISLHSISIGMAACQLGLAGRMSLWRTADIEI